MFDVAVIAEPKVSEAAATATGYEVIANAPTVQPVTKIYFEIDCRVLDTSLISNAVCH